MINDLYYKCSDFLAGYDKIKFDINTDDNNYNTMLNIQFISDLSTNTTTTLIDRYSKKELFKLNFPTNNTFYSKKYIFFIIQHQTLIIFILYYA